MAQKRRPMTTTAAAILLTTLLAAADGATPNNNRTAPAATAPRQPAPAVRVDLAPPAPGRHEECEGARFGASDGGARVGGACCLIDDCIDVGSEAECSAHGGVYFAGDECAEGVCGIGACCFPDGCVDTDAYTCIMGGRDFMGAGTQCIDDPCGIGWGACCLSAGCEELSLEECDTAGGIWVGPGIECAGGPCDSGACCLENDECIDNMRFECDDLGGAFHAGVDCASDPCTDYGDCPETSIFHQTKDTPDDDFQGMTSEESTGLRRYENFTGVPGAVDSLLWWGFDMYWSNGWYDCEETDNTFVIGFYEDAGGVPGDVVCSYELTAERKPTGISYLGSELNEYTVDLPEPCVLVNGWISIMGKGEPGCWFLWLSAGYGYSYCEGCQPPEQDWDLSICMIGEEGGVFGACCNDLTAECAEDVEIIDCLGEDMRFLPYATCDDMDPPCGVIIGACCFPDDTCTIETEEDCNTLGGDWLGKNTICASCPCITPCPDGGVPEGEPTCYDGYIDEFNGGCEAEKELFSPICPGQVVCGESGVFDSGGEMAPDFDWYELHVNADTRLTFSVEAEFRPGIWILEGNEGCPGWVLTQAQAYECEEVSAAVDVYPGTYWLVVAPWSWTDSAACGARYTALVTLDPYCPADFDGDGDVDTADLLFLLGAWGRPEGDLDCDGDTDTADLLALLAAWGECP
jgi:hypothetical protein